MLLAGGVPRDRAQSGAATVERPAACQGRGPGAEPLAAVYFLCASLAEESEMPPDAGPCH